ncbi:predicted protein [Verticillium alfalfae VaMs.102]|uniref:Predicted protein n=1 Tax=Verticillium alfalfae (strain VaMs.102 / ATCC MYA-4576 / FGSC 10136) TaxID=526221 RepID=C9SZ13_VERA1|nr:predicted protein [Verticillium alfalfae VaMs.102]EEY24028.1 predicted protein [Verticillium alfalfae VaMs.102]
MDEPLGCLSFSVSRVVLTGQTTPGVSHIWRQWSALRLLQEPTKSFDIQRSRSWRVVSRHLRSPGRQHSTRRLQAVMDKLPLNVSGPESEGMDRGGSRARESEPAVVEVAPPTGLPARKMGQRHQLFVIARVGNYYRPLAAIHHQWLYGVSALRSCRRLLRIFSDPSNRIALKHELYLAVDFFQKRGPPPSDPPECEDPERTACPFPFITTYLAVGAAYDFDLGRVDTIHELAFDTGFDQGDNNDGITVLDITDLVDVRYCFVNLFETWPWGEWDADRPVADTINTGPHTQPQTLGPTHSLRDLAAAQLFSRLLATEDDFEPSILDEVRDLPGFQKVLREHLLCHSKQVGPAQTSSHLLQLAYAGEDLLEWNSYVNLTAEAIKVALTSDALKSATGIILTIQRHVSPAELVEALSSLDSLHALQVLDRPDRKDEQSSNQLFEALSKSTHPLAIKKLTLSGLYANGIRQNIWRPCRDNPVTLEPYPLVQLLVAHEGKDGDMLKSLGGALESFCLGDAALTPVKVATGLFQYLMTEVQSWPIRNGTGLAVAHCFSCSPPALGSDSVEIAPLPAETYKIAKAACHSSGFGGLYSKLRDLTPRAWTAVVSESKDTHDANGVTTQTTHLQFKYAFIRSKKAIPVDPETRRGSDIQPSEIEVVDLAGFLHLTAPEIDTSKLAHHFDELDAAVVRATDERNRITTPQHIPLLSLLSPEEACRLLNQFVASVPEVQEACVRISRWGGGKNIFICLNLESELIGSSVGHWILDLGFNHDG